MPAAGAGSWRHCCCQPCRWQRSGQAGPGAACAARKPPSPPLPPTDHGGHGAPAPDAALQRDHAQGGAARPAAAAPKLHFLSHGRPKGAATAPCPALAWVPPSLPPPPTHTSTPSAATQALAEFARAGLRDPELVRLDVDTKLSPDLSLAFFTVGGRGGQGASGGLRGRSPPWLQLGFGRGPAPLAAPALVAPGRRACPSHRARDAPPPLSSPPDRSGPRRSRQRCSSFCRCVCVRGGETLVPAVSRTLPCPST